MRSTIAKLSVSLEKKAEAASDAAHSAAACDVCQRNGRLIASINPQYGVVRESDYVLLFVFTWSHKDTPLDHPKDTTLTH